MKGHPIPPPSTHLPVHPRTLKQEELKGVLFFINLSCARHWARQGTWLASPYPSTARSSHQTHPRQGVLTTAPTYVGELEVDAGGKQKSMRVNRVRDLFSILGEGVWNEEGRK